MGVVALLHERPRRDGGVGPFVAPREPGKLYGRDSERLAEIALSQVMRRLEGTTPRKMSRLQVSLILIPNVNCKGSSTT